MQNKSAIQVFAILLTLACIFHLSFSLVTNSVEKKAKNYAAGDAELERDYLDSMNSVVVYNLGLVKYTYDDCKRREINLGLDLKGGMNVTLEVSIPDLLLTMSNKSTDTAFRKALKMAMDQQTNTQKNFVDLFVDAYQTIKPGGRLSSPTIFGHNEQDLIKIQMSNDEVRAILKRESDMAIDRTFEVLNARIDNFGVTQPNIQKLEGSNRILVELAGVQDPNRVRDLLERPAKLEFFETYDNKEVYPYLERVNKALVTIVKRQSRGEGDTLNTDTLGLPEDTLNQVAVLPEDTTDSLGNQLTTTTPTDSDKLMQENIEQQRKDNPLWAIMVPYTGKDENDQEVLVPGAIIGYAVEKDTALLFDYLENPDIKPLLPRNLKLALGTKDANEKGNPFVKVYALKVDAKGNPALGGDVVTDASYQPDDQRGGFQVSMKMNGEGANKWAEITEKNIGRSVAIVLDGRVYSAPNVENAITGGISSITGNFSFTDAKTLASVLKAGKLPTPAKIVDQAVVGPTLGKESIRAGFVSLVVAFALILIYIAFYYGRAGLFADIALLANLFFQLGAMAAFNTTLTLAGVTGLVLTIGMSVDANVIIFERIREELREGKGLRMAIADGYKSASSAIIDSNATSLLTGIILIIFGGGPVKSFAVTLVIGNLTSIFSCIFLARLFFEWQLNRKKDVSFFTKMTKNAFLNSNFNFVGKRKIFYVVSGLIVAAGIASFVTKGFNLGVDLKGGRSYTVIFDNSNFTTQDIGSALGQKWSIEDPVVKYYGQSDRVKIITKYKYDDNTPGIDSLIALEMYQALGKFYTDTALTFQTFADVKQTPGIVESAKTGPTVARDVRIKSLYAIALSIMLIFFYVLIRFKGWQFGVGAITALVHDVIVVLAFYSILDGILPFSMELDQAVIGSILTVMGYSINDKVIIFDRIREYLGMGRKGSTKSLINDAINSTLGRTMNTSLSVLLVVVTAFLFGGTAIKGLTFALLVGVIVGTYSSYFIATPMVVDLKKDRPEDKK